MAENKETLSLPSQMADDLKALLEQQTDRVENLQCELKTLERKIADAKFQQDLLELQTKVALSPKFLRHSLKL